MFFTPSLSHPLFHTYFRTFFHTYFLTFFLTLLTMSLISKTAFSTDAQRAFGGRKNPSGDVDGWSTVASSRRPMDWSRSALRTAIPKKDDFPALSGTTDSPKSCAASAADGKLSYTDMMKKRLAEEAVASDEAARVHELSRKVAAANELDSHSLHHRTHTAFRSHTTSQTIDEYSGMHYADDMGEGDLDDDSYGCGLNQRHKQKHLDINYDEPPPMDDIMDDEDYRHNLEEDDRF